MEILKQLLEDMFKTRKLDSFTHHEGTKGIIPIRFEGLLRSHIDLQSVSSDQNIPSDDHVTFKRKTKAQTKRDLDRSKGLIKRYNTRAQNSLVENPRHSNQFGNISYSNLSPEADIFVPMFDPSDIIRCSSPVIDSHQNNQEETDGASSVKAYGIDGNLHAWIKAFLTDRRQRVTVNGANSCWEQVTSGVPQGSVLGPLLFVVFIDDMPEVVDDNSLLIMFADDAKLHRDQNHLRQRNEQNDCNKLSGWADTNGMFHHPDKCHVLKIGER